MNNRLLPLSLIEAPDVVYHYTSFDILRLIIQGSSVRFGHIRPQNDRGEVIHFQDMASEYLREQMETASDSYAVSHLESLNQPFLFEFGVKEGERENLPISRRPYNICFSEDGDCKSQWKEYADTDKGVAIGFKTEYFNNCGFERLAQDLGNDIGLFEKVIYKQESKYEILSKIVLDQIAWLKGVDVFQHLCKDAGWHEEREWRLYFAPNPSSEIPVNQQDRTIRQNIFWKDDQPTKYSGMQRLPFLKFGTDFSPIRKIILGPFCPNSTKDVKKILEHCEFPVDFIDVRESNIQKRNA